MTMNAEEIVRALAQCDPHAASEVSGDTYCAVCGEDTDKRLLTEHAPDCPWRMAVEATRDDGD